MSRKRDREKRARRMGWFFWRRECCHSGEDIVAAGYQCPDIKAGGTYCTEIPF
jgi:hypothetical protein